MKSINFTDMLGKFIGFLPLASSQSPSSGDGFLLSTHISLEDNQAEDKYVRTLLGGNAEYYVILVTDAGFVAFPPNASREFSQNPNVSTLTEICEQ